MDSKNLKKFLCLLFALLVAFCFEWSAIAMKAAQNKGDLMSSLKAAMEQRRVSIEPKEEVKVEEDEWGESIEASVEKEEPKPTEKKIGKVKIPEGIKSFIGGKAKQIKEGLAETEKIPTPPAPPRAGVGFVPPVPPVPSGVGVSNVPPVPQVPSGAGIGFVPPVPQVPSGAGIGFVPPVPPPPPSTIEVKSPELSSDLYNKRLLAAIELLGRSYADGKLKENEMEQLVKEFTNLVENIIVATPEQRKLIHLTGGFLSKVPSEATIEQKEKFEVISKQAQEEETPEKRAKDLFDQVEKVRKMDDKSISNYFKDLFAFAEELEIAKNEGKFFDGEENFKKLLKYVSNLLKYVSSVPQFGVFSVHASEWSDRIIKEVAKGEAPKEEEKKEEVNPEEVKLAPVTKRERPVIKRGSSPVSKAPVRQTPARRR